jgi:hypothetical protein
MMGPDIPITNDMTDAQIERLMQLLLLMVCGPDPEPMTTLAALTA